MITEREFPAKPAVDCGKGENGDKSARNSANFVALFISQMFL